MSLDPPVPDDTSSLEESSPPAESDSAGAHSSREGTFGPPPSHDEVKASIEALLYAAQEPLSVRELRKALSDATPEAIQRGLDDLLEAYGCPGRGLQIVEVARGYQITTRPEHHDRISRLFKVKPPSRLSVQALETLAAIAYRQPITVPEIMELRGVRSAGVVRTLLEKKLIRIVGRKPVVGRPLLYGTTKEFMLRFGLKDLSDLPRLEDMAEIFGSEVALSLEEDGLKQPFPEGGREASTDRPVENSGPSLPGARPVGQKPDEPPA